MIAPWKLFAVFDDFHLAIIIHDNLELIDGVTTPNYDEPKILLEKSDTRVKSPECKPLNFIFFPFKQGVI
jgi:hypothetical protein